MGAYRPGHRPCARGSFRERVEDPKAEGACVGSGILRPHEAFPVACQRQPLLAMGTHLLTPRMAGVLERINRARRKPFHAMTPVEARAVYAAGAEVLDLPRAPLPRVEELSVPGGDGQSRPARLYGAQPLGMSRPCPVLLYFHGGGFVLGGLDTHDSLCRQLALRCGGGRALVGLPAGP